VFCFIAGFGVFLKPIERNEEALRFFENLPNFLFLIYSCWGVRVYASYHFSVCFPVSVHLCELSLSRVLLSNSLRERIQYKKPRPVVCLWVGYRILFVQGCIGQSYSVT
jgi:hypothetical protein